MFTLKLLYITVVEVLAIFINADTRIKGVQIGDHETKQNILLMMQPFFFRDITCITRMQVILKLQEVSSSNIKASKSQAVIRKKN